MLDRQEVDAAIASHSGDMDEVHIVFNQARASYQSLFDLERAIYQRITVNPLAFIDLLHNKIRISIPLTDDGSFRREVEALIAASGVPSAAISVEVIDLDAANVNFTPGA